MGYKYVADVKVLILNTSAEKVKKTARLTPII